jgi:hypothetical protein
MNHTWQSSNITPELKAAGLPSADATQWLAEVTPAFGGPIARDKLWFFGSARFFKFELAPAGAFYADGRPGFNDGNVHNATARLTWQPTPRNKVSVYGDRSWKGSSNGGTGPGRDWATATTLGPNSNYYFYQGKWTFPATNKLLFENGASFAVYNALTGAYQAGILQPRGTPAWYADAARLDLVTGRAWVAPASNSGAYYKQPNQMFTSAVSYVTGSHTFKTGIQWRWGYSQQQQENGNADLVQQYRNGVPDSVAVAAQPFVIKGVLDADVGVYLQDSWTIRRLTVNPGVRFEYFKSSIGATQSAAGRFVPARSVAAGTPVTPFSDIAPRFSAAYDLFGDAKTALKVSANKYMKTVGALFSLPYDPISSVPDIRNWFDCDLIPGTSTCSGRVLATNRDDIAQDNEIGPSNNSRFGLAPDRRADPNLKREYDWDYTVSVQHQLFPRVSVTAAWYYLRSYDVSVTKNAAISFADYTSFQTPNPLNNGELITVYNLNRVKQGVVDTVDTTSNINRRLYTGYELSAQARLPNGGVMLGGWSMERTRLITCDTSDPNQLRFCDQTGQTYQELGGVPTLPYRHEFKLATSYPLPWHLNAGLSFVSYPGVVTTTTTTAGSLSATTFGSLGVNWVVPPALFPGGRTQSVTVPLIAPGTQYPPRWNQLDVNVKRLFRLGHYGVEPAADIFNLLNSSVVLTQQQAFGSALGQPLTTLQGRFLKLGIRITF